MVYAITNLDLPGTLKVSGSSTFNGNIVMDKGTEEPKIAFYRTVNSVVHRGLLNINSAGAVKLGIYDNDWVEKNSIVLSDTLTTISGDILAKKSIITEGILSLKNSEQYPQLHFQPSFSSTPIFKIYGSAGSATAFKQGAYAWFRLYSFTDGATSTSSYYEDYRLPSVDVGLTGTKGYNILTSKPLSTNILYRKYDKDTSSAGNAITWYKSNGTTIQHMLGAHNTGNTHGAVYIIPYTPTSGVDTWSGTEGLYIGKTKFTWESKTIYHTGNIVTCSNTSEITSPTEGMIALIVS